MHRLGSLRPNTRRTHAGSGVNLFKTPKAGSPGPAQSCRDVAQPGRALAWGARGRQFKSARPDHSSFLTLLPSDRVAFVSRIEAYAFRRAVQWHRRQLRLLTRFLPSQNGHECNRLAWASWLSDFIDFAEFTREPPHDLEPAQYRMPKVISTNCVLMRLLGA